RIRSPGTALRPGWTMPIAPSSRTCRPNRGRAKPRNRARRNHGPRMASATGTGGVAGQPVGPLVDTTPAREPQTVELAGRHGRVEKLDPKRHTDDLWQVVEGHDEIWTYLAYGPFPDKEAFALWLKARAGIPDPFSYVIIDKSSRAVGIAALMAVRPEMR